MRTRSPMGAGVLLLAALLTGCAAPPPASRLAEYEHRAEQIHASMLDEVPVAGAATIRPTSQAQYGEPVVLGQPEHDVAFWTTWSTVELTADTAPSEVAEAVGAALVEDHWTSEPTVDQGGTMPYASVYRLPDADGEWIVQIAWPAADDDRRISLSVQSPLTVRGDPSARER